MFIPRSLIAAFAAVTVGLPAFADLPGKQSFDSDGVEIKYFDVGEGTPVLLIHGFAASALTNWTRLIPRLSREFRVIALDNRGHGGSGKPKGADAYDDEMIEDPIRLLDHLGIEKAHVVGYSMGGYIVAKMITMHPNRMLSATIGGAGWAKSRGIRDETLERLATSIDDDRDLSPLFNGLSPDGEGHSDIGMKVINTLIKFSNDVDALADVARGMKKHTVSEDEIRAITIPVQLIVGSEDPLRKAAENWVAIRPDHSLTVVDGGNHASTFRTSEFYDTVRAFLLEHAP